MRLKSFGGAGIDPWIADKFKCGFGPAHPAIVRSNVPAPMPRATIWLAVIWKACSVPAEIGSLNAGGLLR
jgi:hypothetical protein